jgi:DNA primase
VSDTRRIDFLFLPPEHDPDSFVREHGASGFARALDTALPLSEFMLTELSSRVDLDTPEGRARLQADARPLLRAIPPVALRLQLIQSVAARARVRPEDVQQFLAAEEGPGAGPGGSGRTAAVPRDESGPRRFLPNPAPRTRPVPTGAALPDLQRRARLLLAVHPELAKEGWPTEFLPPAVTEWLARLALLPDGASFAGLLESLREADPQEAAALQSQVTRDRGLLADLSLEDARAEFEGALGQLRSQGLREAVDELAKSGLQDEASRERYAQLQAMRRALTTP